ncbi:MAG: alkaline phosphatase D family protein [Deltaproteobacteria bacterium]|nr:alkaline phosphatase D family protein [Deltaproteobacteria bacterium]
MSNDESKRLSRRDAMRGLFTVSAATIVGCGPGESTPDASMLPMDDASSPPDAHTVPDAGNDGGPGWDAGPPPTGTFHHGVASGDPLPSAVMLWTRVSEQTAAVTVEWEIATSADFATLVTSGTFETDAERDFTVKVDATGLAPATTYFYRFRLGAMTSPIGRTRTAPEGEVSRLRFAVCSCSSYAHGYFHGYRRIAERADLDAVIHLGDYIYEYGTGKYGEVRDYDPPHEIVTLEDYRRRHAHYKLDRDLQEAHRQHPFITTWDDHETADNSYATGANNHEPDEGSWSDRLAAASRAYREWMPFRDPSEGPRLQLYRALRYGDLVDLVVLDTRIWARDPQAAGTSDPTLDDETRQLIGTDQEAWLLERLRTSTARWKVLCQQVMVAQLPVILNTDAWDGYPAQRNRLFSFLADNPTGERDDVVVLTGDIHSSWASDLTPTPTDPSTYTPATGEGALAVEFICPGITSPGAGPGAERLLRDRLPTDGPHIKYLDLVRRGYIVLDVDADRAQASWFHLADVTSVAGGAESFSAAWETESGQNHLVESTSPATPRSDAPPLAPS